MQTSAIGGQAASDVFDLSPDLHAFLELFEEGVVLFNDQQQVIYSNPAASQFASSAGLGSIDQLMSLLPVQAHDASADSSWLCDIVDEPRSLVLAARLYPLRRGRLNGRALLLRDVSDLRAHEKELTQRHAELQEAYVRLAGTREQLLQSEKMASIGQLAAGIAHEINNPIGYVHSNLTTLRDYARGLLDLIDTYHKAMQSADPLAERNELDNQRQRLDFDFVSSDLPQLLNESREGIERVRKIVQDLKEFSHVGREEEWKRADLHRGLESTLNIVWNDLKYKAKINREFSDLPLVECLPSELNQVFMNLLLNAAHAIGERGEITLRSGTEAEHAWIEISDSGKGIPEEVLPRIFDPFFTTKPVGTGTGLGLSISYGIIKKHHGRIEASNRPEGGACFRITLPVTHQSGLSSE